MVGRDRFSQLLPLQLPETISPSCPPSLPNTPDARKRAKTFSHSHPRLSIKYCDNSEELERDTKRQKPLSCAHYTISFGRVDLYLFHPFLHCCIVLLTRRREEAKTCLKWQAFKARLWPRILINIVLSLDYHDTLSSYQMDHRHGDLSKRLGNGSILFCHF